MFALGDVEHADNEGRPPMVHAAPAIGRTPDRRTVGALELDFVVAQDVVFADERADLFEIVRFDVVISDVLVFFLLPFAAEQV